MGWGELLVSLDRRCGVTDSLLSTAPLSTIFLPKFLNSLVNCDGRQGMVSSTHFQYLSSSVPVWGRMRPMSAEHTGHTLRVGEGKITASDGG
jgi:hypothetical protein